MSRNVTPTDSSGVVIITTNCAFQTIFLESLFSSHAYANEDASFFDKKKKNKNKNNTSLQFNNALITIGIHGMNGPKETFCS